METTSYICLGASFLALILSIILGRIAIPLLHKLKFGQTILDIGPSWHKKKQGTPTMGGLFFIGAFLFTVAFTILTCETALKIPILSNLDQKSMIRFTAGLGLALGSGIIGFADDYIKIVKKRNLGLTDKQKFALQVLLSGTYAGILYAYKADNVFIPFIGETSLSFWFVPLCMFFVVGMNNATNLTDGVDGLCGSITFISTIAFTFAATTLYCGSQGILVASLAGAIAGYLVYNLHPAKVMMGDTGSLFIGGLLCAVAFGIGHPLLLIPFGLVFILETLSVILQVSYFKLTHGKRIFKMSPIHHHFEMCGWNENKIVFVFTTVELVVSVITIVLCYFYAW